MPLSKILGMVEITRAYTGRLAPEYYGGRRYENVDFFASVKGQCLATDAEEAAQILHQFARDQVIDAINAEIDIIQGREPAPMEETATEPAIQVAEQQPPPAPTQREPQVYHVAEKQPEAPAPTATAPQQPPATNNGKGKRPSTVIADRLKAQGLTHEHLGYWLEYFFPDRKPDETLTQDQYVEAFTELETWIKANSVPKFVKWYASQKQVPPAAPAQTQPVPQPAHTDNTQVDPIFEAARNAVMQRFGSWTPENVNLGALWCAEQVKDVGVLDSVLSSAGINGQTPPARIESFLAITRHLTLNSVAALMAYSAKTGSPLSMIEDQLSKEVGKPIREATDIPPNAVMEAFQKLIA